MRTMNVRIEGEISHISESINMLDWDRRAQFVDIRRRRRQSVQLPCNLADSFRLGSWDCMAGRRRLQVHRIRDIHRHNAEYDKQFLV